MMREVGILEAKTRFSSLVTDVEREGEPIIITRNGRRVARLVREPVTIERPRMSGAELSRRLQELRERYSDLEAEAREPLDLHEAMGRRD